MKKKQKTPLFSLVKQLIINGAIFFGLIFFTFWAIFKDQDINLYDADAQQSDPSK